MYFGSFMEKKKRTLVRIEKRFCLEHRRAPATKSAHIIYGGSNKQKTEEAKKIFPTRIELVTSSV